MKLIKLFRYLLAFFTFVNTLPLYGEIQSVTITWQSALCPPACTELLQKEFQKIRGVAEVNMQTTAGQAQLKWQPNVPFSFAPINGAMRMIGPRLNMIRLSVRGHIRTHGDKITLVSDQDGTVFNLVNRITPVEGEYTEQYNIQTRVFPPSVVEDLRKKEKTHQMVIIEGPLFQPERIIPLQLVLEYMKDAPKPAER